MNQQAYPQSYFPVDGASYSANSPKPPVKSSSFASDDGRSWAMLIHLGQFAHAIFPLAGVVIPIVVWQIKKDEHPQIDEHGKAVCNWIISYMLYTFVAGLLSIILIGIPLILVLAVLGIVFPILGTIKAADGKVWKYPLSIRFIK